ncbi:MAG: hypothetical protein ACR2GW_09125 [Pyrinomonadaceae bacterium]
MSSNVATLLLTEENLICSTLTASNALAATERSTLPDAAPATLPAPLYELLAHIDPYPTGTLLRHIFSELSRILDYLRLSEANFQQDRVMLSTLSVLKHVRREAHALSSFVESLATRTEDFPEPLREAFDSLGYAINHEVERVSDEELLGLEDGTPPNVVRAKLENAHGLLRNCFQQSTISLAQVIDPEFDGACLFDGLPARRQQSLILIQELQGLIKCARRAASDRDQFAIAVMTEHLKRFRKGTMCYLMYKDWEECERFIERLAKPQTPATFGPLLENLSCYLETLLIHVQRRSALSDSALHFSDTEH